MKKIVAVHLLEIRYSHLIDFPNIAREVLSAFTPLTTNLKIENENLVTSRYTLLFEKDFYSIIVSWDRITLKYEGDLANLTRLNSFVEEPFLNIFTKLKESKNFGSINNIIIYTVYLNLIDSGKPTEIVKNFAKKFINESNTSSILNEQTDLAVVLENKNGDVTTTVTFGPYLSSADLKKKNIVPETKEVIERVNQIGEIAEIIISETSKTFNFQKYKVLINSSEAITTRLWQ